jgi:hypothetical protein
MPLYKFGDSDLFYNQIKAHPSCSFFIYDSKIYYNNKATEPGSFSASVPNVPVGHINLFEYNVDRLEYSTDRYIGPATGSDGVPDTGQIYPFVYKGLQKVAFKNIKRVDFIHNYNPGDVITGSYQLSASISRQVYTADHNFNTTNHTGSALRNSLDFAKRLGDHYNIAAGSNVETTVIQIPSIFYGSEIKKGTVDLKFYVTGALVGQLKDNRQNGALIQHSGTEGSAFNSQIAGVVLYKEGFIILTGSWTLASDMPATNLFYDKDVDNSAINSVAKWTRFGFGANDNAPSAGANLQNGSASFSIDFAGTHKIPTVTMHAHANRGELNHSNNLTYISASQLAANTPATGTYLYREQELEIKNIHSASYADPSGSLVKTTYITKVGIYDKRKKLIGIASLAKPVKKTEDRDLTFKLKLDI